MLRQNYPRSESWTVGAVTAFPDSVKAVAGSDYPCIRHRALQVFAEILEHCGMLGRERGKIIDAFIHSSRQTGRGHVVPQDSSVDYLSKKSGLGDKLLYKVRAIFCALGVNALTRSRAT